MKSKNTLEDFEDCWKTDMGGAIAGERVVIRGKDLFTELSDYSWLKLLMYMITGRVFDENELEVLDKIWAQTISYPDPRVWNNRIGALAGTVRSTASLGVSAGSAVSEAKVYGGQATLSAFTFLIECEERVSKGEELLEIIKQELKINRAIFGYGRPVVSRDERIAPIERLMKKHGYSDGKYVSLAYEVEKILQEGKWRYQMNIGGLAAAIAADMGLTAKEYYLWLVNGYNAGITACYVDSSNKEIGTLFPLRCERISYSGVAKRTWK